METTSHSTSGEKVHRYRCQGCAADLVYEPRDGGLTCPYCGHQEKIPQSAEEVQERSFEEYLAIASRKTVVIAQQALEVRCETCGATVTFVPPEVARDCDFCDAPMVAQPKAADPIVAPEAVLPFKLRKNDATGAIKQWIASRWFAPSKLKEFATHEGINGVYIPYWTYDSQTFSFYDGERGDHYYVTETYTETDSQGHTQTKTRQVQKTRWTSVSGQVSRWFDDILVPATKSLPKDKLDHLEPWDLPELKPYDPAFLSGYKAQRYQVELGEGFEIAKQFMDDVIREDVRRDIGGDEQRIHQVSTQFSAITFKHLLLPVFVGAYRFNQKLYQVVVNGRTGEVQGERPYSIVKIAGFILMILVIIGLIVLIFNLAGK